MSFRSSLVSSYSTGQEFARWLLRDFARVRMPMKDGVIISVNKVFDGANLIEDIFSEF